MKSAFYKSILLLCGVLFIAGCKIGTEESLPNVLVIFPDQLRRYSAGYWSEEPYLSQVVGVPDPVHTPTIDELAGNGVVFTRAISNFPLCSPYRGMMLTGMYPQQNGIWGNCKAGRIHDLKDDVVTFTDIFYEAGYNTAYFGKCHWEKTEALFDKTGNYTGSLEAPGGFYVNTYDTYVPPGKSRHNIEYFYQALKDSHFDSRVYSNDPEVVDGKSDGELHRPGVFSPKNEAEQIIKYLHNSHGQRDPEKPFCMIWSLNPPHNPWNDQNTDMEMMHKFYDRDKFPELKELVLRENADLEVANYARNYFANVTAVDHYIGLVIEELEKLGMLENTIITFSSDHGEMLGSHGRTGKNVFETEAVSVPFIMHYPRKVQTGICDVIFGATDVLPTIMGMAGLKDLIPSSVQGEDYSELVIDPGSSFTENPVSALLILGTARGLQNNRYTLCLEEDTLENKIMASYLYDNIEDPYQKNRLELDEQPEVVNEMLAVLGQKLKYANDPWYVQRKYSELVIYPD